MHLRFVHLDEYHVCRFYSFNMFKTLAVDGVQQEDHASVEGLLSYRPVDERRWYTFVEEPECV